MNCWINHDSTVDVDLDNLLSFLIVCQTLMTFVIDALEGNKFLASLDEFGSKLCLIFVVL